MVCYGMRQKNGEEVGLESRGGQGDGGTQLDRLSADYPLEGVNDMSRKHILQELVNLGKF